MDCRVSACVLILTAIVKFAQTLPIPLTGAIAHENLLLSLDATTRFMIASHLEIEGFNPQERQTIFKHIGKLIQQKAIIDDIINGLDENETISSSLSATQTLVENVLNKTLHWLNLTLGETLTEELLKIVAVQLEIKSITKELRNILTGTVRVGFFGNCDSAVNSILNFSNLSIKCHVIRSVIPYCYHKVQEQCSEIV